MGFSITELLIVLAIVALLFGTKKLRNIGGDLGSAIKSFRTAMNDNDGQGATTPAKKPASEGCQVIEGEVETKADDAPRDV
ncbi:MAG: hypothetical protein A2W28_08495 [Gammaproteobacteria bacterium RBG_16_51_14]|nr:MAG: hypothetical protein A2W28_08495 [Gammaproteobacteria bacterium RBG_16_51_14]